MGSNLDLTLRETVQTSFHDFFVALQGDGTAIQSFLGTWSTFNNTIRTHRDNLQRETLLAVHNLASMVEVVVSDMIDLEKSTQNLLQESDISKIIEDSLSNLSISDGQNSLIQKDASRIPAYIRPSYEWLLSNLHNPYPSKDVKKTISRQSKCSAKDIDAWFIDVRKRIGWNRLRKTRFGNKQEKIIAAATYIFKPVTSSFNDDLNGSLMSEMDSNEIYRGDFALMASAARRLYADKFPELASSLNTRQPETPNVTGSPKTTIELPVNHPATFSPPIESDNTFIPYPTPEPSPSPSESPSLPISETSHNSRKRRQASSLTCEDSNEDISARPLKRLRCGFTSLGHTAASSLPSPTPSVDLSEGTEEAGCSPQLVDTIPRAVTETLNLKRKRRLSDGDTQGPTKRPHNAFCLPRMQTVSDPFPVIKTMHEDNFEGLLEGKVFFEEDLSDNIPLPANMEDPLSLTDIDLHQYDFSPYNPVVYLPNTHTWGSEESGTSLYSPNSSDESSAFEALSFTAALQDASLSFMSTANMHFDVVAAPSYQLDLQCDTINALDDFAIFQNSDLLSLSPGHLPDPSLSIVEAYSNLSGLDISPTTYIKTPVLGNFNHAVPRGLPSSLENEAKRARAQALREELALYEAEGL